MKKNNVVTLLGIALAVAIVATGVFYGLFVNKLSSSTGSGKTLVVAARGLKTGTVVKDGDVKTIPWPASEIPKGGFEKVDEVMGGTVFDAIAEDEPVLTPHLSPAAAVVASAPLSNGVPAGMRAVSVHVADSTGVLALLRAGHRVDVLVVKRQESSGATEVRTALQNLEVFSVNLQPEQISQGQNAPVVTLLAKPSQADILAAADAGAKVRLILRNPLDVEMRGSTALSLDTVMHGSGASSQP